VRRFLPILLAAAALHAADRWTEYRSGPFRVFSNAGDRPARERLAEMEQIRHVLGGMLGKDKAGNELESVWPIDLVLFPNAKEYGPSALPRPFVEGGSAILSAWSADTPQPLDWRRELVLRLIADNAPRMPPPIETALGDLLSTIQVNATRVSLGAPLPSGALPGGRLRAWAKVQLLATHPDYAGRFRIYLNNLQQGGEESVAARNAFDTVLADIEKRVDEYVRAGTFAAAPVPGLALNPNRDFVEKPVAESAVAALLAELKAAGKSFPPDSPRGLLAKNTRAALELAASANPKWAEPHVKLAALEANPVTRIKELKAAATLEPRNSSYWQALAIAQAAADQYADASKSWASAERAAATDAERGQIRQTRRDLEERRTEFELAERKRLAEERAAELQRIKDAAAAEIHAAEEAANRKQGGLKSTQAVVEWWNEESGEPVGGMLTKVDCLTGPLRLTIQKSGGGTAVLLIRDPQKLSVRGASEATFGCGVQRPPRKIQVVHDAKPDAKLGTAGDIKVVEFP
jgi:hypothetical protein